MNQLIFDLLVCYGITAIFIYSDLTKPIRDTLIMIWGQFDKLLSCAMCTGFWVGLIYAWARNHEFQLDYAIASSGTTWLLCAITQAMLWVKVWHEHLYTEHRSM